MLLNKLQCVQCRAGDMDLEADSLRCLSCGTAYPLRAGRFPDFLTEAHRSQLEGEIEFWEAHYGDTVYESENEASYQAWAELIGASPRDEVIELGCGSGPQLRRIEAKLRVGLEPVLGLLTATTGFHGLIGTVENIPVQDGAFDLVYFNYSLHHVADKERGFAEAARITRPGGRLVAVEPNLEHPQRRLTSNPKSPFRKFMPLVGFVDPNETFSSAGELRELGRRHGLTCQSLVYRESMYDRPTLRYRVQKLYSRLGRYFLPDRLIYPSFIISFKKPASPGD